MFRGLSVLVFYLLVYLLAVYGHFLWCYDTYLYLLPLGAQYDYLNVIIDYYRFALFTCQCKYKTTTFIYLFIGFLVQIIEYIVTNLVLVVIEQHLSTLTRYGVDDDRRLQVCTHMLHVIRYYQDVIYQ